MGKIKRYKNIVERFLSGEGGQRFFNIAYSIGAAIVILGALFKILHLSGGDILLSVGMGTEVLMFILTAFDRPPRETDIHEIIAALPGVQAAGNAVATPAAMAQTESTDAPAAAVQTGSPVAHGTVAHGTVVQGTVVQGTIVQGPVVAGQMPASGTVVATGTVSASGAAPAVATVAGGAIQAAGAVSSGASLPPEAVAGMSAGVERLSGQIDEYIEKMEALNRSLSGLNAIYELQLRGASANMDSFDSVGRGMQKMRQMAEETAARGEEYREEARQLTENMHRMNEAYARMLKAMTHNPLAAEVADGSNN